MSLDASLSRESGGWTGVREGRDSPRLFVVCYKHQVSLRLRWTGSLGAHMSPRSYVVGWRVCKRLCGILESKRDVDVRPSCCLATTLLHGLRKTTFFLGPRVCGTRPAAIHYENLDRIGSYTYSPACSCSITSKILVLQSAHRRS